jgi:hypothetical protein
VRWHVAKNSSIFLHDTLFAPGLPQGKVFGFCDYQTPMDGCDSCDIAFVPIVQFLLPFEIQVHFLYEKLPKASCAESRSSEEASSRE